MNLDTRSRPPSGGYGLPRKDASASAPPASFGYEAARCPRCQGTQLKTPKLTWWGGFLGPRLLHHTVCASCAFGFDAKSGKSNTAAIAVYLAVAGVVALLIVRICH